MTYSSGCGDPRQGGARRTCTPSYVGFGFEVTEGKKHRLYVHAKYSQLRATVTRARDLPAGYITYAVRLIEQLLDMEAGGAR